MLTSLNDIVLAKGVKFYFKEEGKYSDKTDTEYIDYEEAREVIKILPKLKERYFAWKESRGAEHAEFKYIGNSGIKITLFPFGDADRIAIEVGIYTFWCYISDLDSIISTIEDTLKWLNEKDESLGK